MHRNDKSAFLLYIEPKIEQKSLLPMEDEYTVLMRMALEDSKLGRANYNDPGVPEVNFKEGFGWKGWHTNCDGVRSSNQDYLLPNGLVTNSLCVHYLLFYRAAIEVHDWDKLKELQKFYGRVMQANIGPGKMM
jgi:DNA-directed RNA polymerase subunit H (RpoH/RPB5)